VTSQILLNNLIKVDEVSSTVEFDFYFRLYWKDPRLRMDVFWKALNNPSIASSTLFLCCFLHRMVDRILQKKDKWPTRYLMTRSIEVMTRIIYMLVIIIILFFGADYGTTDVSLVYAFVGLFVLFVIPREYLAVKNKLLPTIEYISS
jgi:hypothetical protein